MNYQTRDGIPIVMRRAKYIEAPGYDRGWITHRVIAEIDGKKVGHVSITWIPDFDDRYADLGAYIKAFHRYEDVEREREKTRAFHGEPFICGVHVEPEYRRRGIAIAMYQEGARWLADEWNLRLRSGDTNEFSKALWAKLRALGEPVVEVDVLSGRRLALDYRKRTRLRPASLVVFLN